MNCGYYDIGAVTKISKRIKESTPFEGESDLPLGGTLRRGHPSSTFRRDLFENQRFRYALYHAARKNKVALRWSWRTANIASRRTIITIVLGQLARASIFASERNEQWLGSSFMSVQFSVVEKSVWLCWTPSGVRSWEIVLTFFHCEKMRFGFFSLCYFIVIFVICIVFTAFFLLHSVITIQSLDLVLAFKKCRGWGSSEISGGTEGFSG